MLEAKVFYPKDSKVKQNFEFIGGVSNWIDLVTAEDVNLEAFEYRKIPLGFAMEIPKGYEALIIARSSTFEKFGVMQTNAVGLIDETYCGEGDIWLYPVLSIRETHIPAGTRICQFRLLKRMEETTFKVVEALDNENRDGFGSTDKL